MGFFIDRVENDGEDTITFKKAAIYYYNTWIMLFLTLCAWQYDGFFWIPFLISVCVMFTFSIAQWSTISEIKRVARKGDVIVRGSKYSFQNPPTYIIGKDNNNETSVSTTTMKRSKKIVHVIGILIGSMIASSTIVVIFDNIFGNGDVSPIETIKMSQLTIAFIVAGLTTLFIPLPIKQFWAFLILCIIPAVTILAQMAIYPSIITGTATPHIKTMASILGHLGGLAAISPMIIATIWKRCSKVKNQPHI